MKVSYAYGQYLGGHSGLGKKRARNLIFTDQGVGLGTFNPKNAFLAWSDIASIEIAGETASKSKVGAVLVFGVLGLAAKGSKKQTVVTVRTKDGQIAYYLIDKASHTDVLGRVVPLLRSAGVPLYSEVQPADSAHQGVDVADQILKLANLKKQGLITEEEFAAKKKQLLGL